jgi:hypothetical protein
MLHEFVELVKAVAWPCVALIFLIKFKVEIRLLLTEVPALVRRMRTAHVPGVKVEFNQLERSLPVAERETPLIELKEPDVPPRPARKKKEKEN